MKVKIGNKIISSEDQPVMVILNNGEKKQIAEIQLEIASWRVPLIP